MEPSYAIMLEKLKDTLFDSILRARDVIKDEITFKMADRLGVTPSLQDWLFAGGWHSIDMITRKEMLDAHNIDKRTAGKIKNYAIRRWFDELEKIWQNNWKKLSYIFDPELMSKRKEGWNEINLVDIKKDREQATPPKGEIKLLDNLFSLLFFDIVIFFEIL